MIRKGGMNPDQSQIVDRPPAPPASNPPLAQKDMFTNRWRKVRAPAPTELQIQIALVERLRLLARKDCVWYHVPNGEHRDKRIAAKLKAMGVMPGVADLVFHWPYQQTLFLELKRGNGALSAAQTHFQNTVTLIGWNYAVARTIDQAVEILTDHGILRPEATVSGGG